MPFEFLAEPENLKENSKGHKTQEVSRVARRRDKKKAQEKTKKKK